GVASQSPGPSAALLTGLTFTRVRVAALPARRPEGRLLRDWGAGVVSGLLPGAPATGAVAAGAQPSGILVAAFVALCGSVGYAAATQLHRRFIPLPMAAGTIVATLAVTGLAVLIDGATVLDRLVDRKSTRLNSSHVKSRMPSSA